MQFTNSKKILNEAKTVLVGGTNSPVRSFKRVGGDAIVAARGEGAYLIDVDGNRYIDFVMSYGPHLFGHAQEKIIKAINEAAKNSTCLGFTGEAEVIWAKKILTRLPYAKEKNYKIRAMSSGTEACTTAIRLSRGVTEKPLIVKCSGHYHGHVDSLLVDAGSGLATLSAHAAPDSKGLPTLLTELSRVVEFNNVEALESLFFNQGDKIAAFIMEPIMGNMGVVPPKLEFLKKARELCTKFGALLIFDEVMTGLRVHRNSAHGLYSIEPDLICLGKIIGGGTPLAALVGSEKFMNQLAPLGGVYQAGTLSGNPLSINAGIAMLDLIDEFDPYSKLESIGAHMEKVFLEEAAEKKIPLVVNRVGSMISFYFRSKKVESASDCRDINEERFKKFFWALINEGIIIPPSPFEALFISTAHEMVKETEFREKVSRVFLKL